MDKPVLKFRADAGQQMGWGHLMRFIAVAQMTETDFDIHFYCLEIPYTIGKELRELGFKLHQINQEDDFLISLKNNELVILDGYHFNEKYQRNIKSTGAKLIYIDVLVTGHQVADLIINLAPGVKNEDYFGEPHTQYLLGPNFALVRQVFLNKIPNFLILSFPLMTHEVIGFSKKSD